MIYLYLKTHIKTGIKYFGKTEQNPYLYEGSGKIWRRIIKKHGKDHTTQIIFQSDNLEEINTFAKKYSLDNYISDNSSFANMIYESGGYNMSDKCNPNYKHGRASGWKSDKTIQKNNDKIRNAEYHKLNRSKACARMKFKYYLLKDNINESKKCYDIWKQLSSKDILSFDEYWSKQQIKGKTNE